MIDKVVISDLTNNDIKLLSELIVNNRKENGKVITTENIQQIKEELTSLVGNSSSITLIAKENNQINGFINGHIISFPIIMGKECYISELFVNPISRGLGIGHKLLEEISKLAKTKCCKRLMLNNPKEYDSYKREFYIKEDFEERTNFANFVKDL